MYGREKLETYTSCELYNPKTETFGVGEVLLKDEADKVMDAMERRIARLFNLVAGYQRNSLGLSAMYNRRLDSELERIQELESENEQLKKEVADYHQLQWQHDALIDENEKLKYALKQRTAQSDANANLWMKELRRGARQEKEIEHLRKENERLKCLALHLFLTVAHDEWSVWTNILYNSESTSKDKERAKRHRSRWGGILNKMLPAYRKAKKELK